MTKLIKLLGIGVLFIGLMSCNKADQKSKESGNKKVTTEETKEVPNKETAAGQEKAKTTVTGKSYADLTEFWNDFKKFALAGDYDKITEMTRFPFLYQSTEMTKADFKEFRFTDTFISGMNTKKAPKKSEMMFLGIKAGEMYEVEYEGQAIYFSKINGDWKFVGILFGE
ncbi:MAG: hypothetical protein NTY74_01950 [Ignavibacteriae bacterium]|nr:hypothetical protein [Ignavibacteriota bacterium]